MGSAHPLNAPYQAFEASDGWIVVGGANQKTWLRMLDALNAPELADDPRFKSGADRMAHLKELESVLQQRFRTKPANRSPDARPRNGRRCRAFGTGSRQSHRPSGEILGHAGQSAHRRAALWRAYARGAARVRIR